MFFVPHLDQCEPAVTGRGSGFYEPLSITTAKLNFDQNPVRSPSSFTTRDGLVFIFTLHIPLCLVQKKRVRAAATCNKREPRFTQVFGGLIATTGAVLSFPHSGADGVHGGLKCGRSKIRLVPCLFSSVVQSYEPGGALANPVRQRQSLDFEGLLLKKKNVWPIWWTQMGAIIPTGSSGSTVGSPPSWTCPGGTLIRSLNQFLLDPGRRSSGSTPRRNAAVGPVLRCLPCFS